MPATLRPAHHPYFHLLLALLLAFGALSSNPRRASATGPVGNGFDSGLGTLRQAIIEASSGATIVLDFNSPPVVTLTGGELVIDKNLTIRGSGIGGATVRRGGGTGRIFRIAAGATVTLDGLTISDGASSTGIGGGIYNQGTLTVTNSVITGNSTTGGGGGIGGGIANEGTLTVTNSTVTGNSASNLGAGIFSYTGTSTVTSSTLSDNTAGFAGGGLYNHTGTTTITNSTVSGNSAGTSGGGLNNTEGSLIVTGSTISGNSGDYGGGLYNYRGPLTLTNSTVSGNNAGTDGGGLFNNEATATLSFATLIQNSAPNGAGIYIDGSNLFPTSATFGRSIVAGNGTQDCLSLNSIFAPVISAGFNVIGANTGCPTGGTGDATLSGALGTLVDTALASNGGPTKTHALPLGSVALERVPAAQCAIAADQRGTARPQGPACDSGAFELVVRTLTLSATSGGSSGHAPSGGGTGPFVYLPGTTVTLNPLPTNGQTFTGWVVDGVAKGWPGPLTLTMNGDHAIQAVFAPTKGFSDMPTGRADLVAITELASRGTIRGFQDGRYGPDEGVQRAQMAALIARAMPAGPGTPPTTLAPPACTAAGSWDCEVWPNTFLDQNGLDVGLWRDVAALGQHNVANGYAQADCAARGKAFPCFGPTDPVTYAETITFITRAMQEKGYWVAQPGAPLPAGVPTVFATPVRTFAFYAGGIPDQPANWNAGATRGWFAQALWAALDSYWRTDGNLPDGRPGGGLVP